MTELPFHKHKISHINDELSEFEKAESLDYDRFYDAGNSIWYKNA
jgi:hypothetical protein